MAEYSFRIRDNQGNHKGFFHDLVSAREALVNYPGGYIQNRWIDGWREVT